MLLRAAGKTGGKWVTHEFRTTPPAPCTPTPLPETAPATLDVAGVYPLPVSGYGVISAKVKTFTLAWGHSLLPELGESGAVGEVFIRDALAEPSCNCCLIALNPCQRPDGGLLNKRIAAASKLALNSPHGRLGVGADFSQGCNDPGPHMTIRAGG